MVQTCVEALVSEKKKKRRGGAKWLKKQVPHIPGTLYGLIKKRQLNVYTPLEIRNLDSEEKHYLTIHCWRKRGSI